MITHHTTSAILGIALAAAIFVLIRRDHLRIRYSVWWLAVAVSALALGLFPGLIDSAGNALGVAYPPTLIIILGLAALLIKMLVMDIEYSRQERNLRRLTQRLAIYEAGQQGDGGNGARPSSESTGK